MVDKTRREILKTGAAATRNRCGSVESVRAAERAGRGSSTRRGRSGIHYEEAGKGHPLLVIPGGGLNSTIAALANPFNPMDVPSATSTAPSRRISATRTTGSRQPRRRRSAVGFLHRRSPRPDGSSGHRQVHGDGLLHRRPVHLEPPEARAQSRRRGRAGAAERVPSGDADALLRQQHDRLGPGIWSSAGPRSRWRRSTSF